MAKKKAAAKKKVTKKKATTRSTSATSTTKKKTGKKAAAAPRASKSSSKQTFREKATSLKKMIEKKIGAVDWKKVGRVGFMVIVFLAAKGSFGPKAALVSRYLVPFGSSLVS